MVAGGSSNVLLQDILPWISQGNNNNRLDDQSPSTVLIHDTLETSGRFLLYLTARHGRKSRILWLTCSASQNQRLIENGLAKVGNGTRNPHATASRTENEQKSQITIRSIVQEIRHTIDSCKEEGRDEIFSPQVFVRQLYKSILSWYKETDEIPSYIFLEDVSALARFVGSRLSYALVFQLCALQQKRQSSPSSGKGSLSLLVTTAGDELSDQMDASSWVGAEDQPSGDTVPPTEHGWECSLVELADWIVDVVPLSTGFSRNLHGRLILTPKTMESDAVVINYCLGENQVSATRIHTSTQSV